jgi:hypothetical protein
MAPITLHGVTLFTKERGRTDDVFDIAIGPEGIQILRPDQEVRLLEWSRVATWEIEQRRKRVLLILRGGGSVTPLMIPGWKVDDLDQVLQDMTAHLAPSGVGPEEIPPSALEVPVAPVPPEPELDVALEVPAAPDLPLPEVDVALDAVAPDDVADDEVADDDVGIEGEVHAGLDLELPEPTPAPTPTPLADMDLSLPAPATAPETVESAKEMDLSLAPPPPVPDPVDLARAAEGGRDKRDERGDGDDTVQRANDRDSDD